MRLEQIGNLGRLLRREEESREGRRLQVAADERHTDSLARGQLRRALRHLDVAGRRRDTFGKSNDIQTVKFACKTADAGLTSALHTIMMGSAAWIIL